MAKFVPNNCRKKVITMNQINNQKNKKKEKKTKQSMKQKQQTKHSLFSFPLLSSLLLVQKVIELVPTVNLNWVGAQGNTILDNLLNLIPKEEEPKKDEAKKEKFVTFSEEVIKCLFVCYYLCFIFLFFF
jgi:hypothetical protein